MGMFTLSPSILGLDIWLTDAQIPLLVVVLCALLYGRFPEVFSHAGSFVSELLRARVPAHPEVVAGAPGAVEV